MTYFIVFLSAIAFTLAYGTYLLWKFLPALKVIDPVGHQCDNKAVWMPVIASMPEKVANIGAMNIVVMSPDGSANYTAKPIEYGVVRFMGVQCSSCEDQLECKACGRTPRIASLITDRDDYSRILNCCRTPVFGDKQ